MHITFYWVYSLPNWLFGVMCVTAFAGFGLVGLMFTRGFVRRVHAADHSHNDIVSYYLAAVTVFYGITLGLVAVGTWNNYSGVEDKVDREAQDLASLYRDVNGLPEPGRSAMTGDLRAYAKEVVENSWPQMRKGIVPVGSAVMINNFQAHLTTFQPSTMGEQVLFAEAYKQFNELVESRRARLDAVTTSLPRSLWWLVILGALFCLTTSMFFDVRSYAMHRWMTVLMGGLLGLIIFLVATLDCPFRGKVSVGPVAIERVQAQLMR